MRSQMWQAVNYVDITTNVLSVYSCKFDEEKLRNCKIIYLKFFWLRDS